MILPLILFALVLQSSSVAEPSRSATTKISPQRNDRLLLKPRYGANQEQIERLHAQNGCKIIQIFHDLGDLQLIELPKASAIGRYLNTYRDSSLFEYAEPDYLVGIASVFPSDPKFMDGTLWALNNAGQNGGTPNADIDAPEAWVDVHSASNVIVAVVDTGVRYTHEDLSSNIWVNPADGTHGTNAVAGTLDPADDNGHGTVIAGVIGATGNNGLGVVGVAWQVQIMACKFIDSLGNGSVADAIACFEFARSHGAQIINASWGLGEMSLSLSNAVQAARAAGIIVVAAAGNDSQDNDLIPYYPASLNIDNIVAVAASTRTDALYALSNFGSTNVDLVAPGYEIYSTTFQSNESYGYDEGTSVAAGFVSGTMALLRASFPLDSYSNHIQRLLQNVDSLPGLDGLCATGGRLNLRKALGVPLIPPLLEAFSSQDQLLGIRLSGTPGRPYILEGSTNFMDWSPVMTNYTGFDGTFLYLEGITNNQKKFYRAFQSP